MTSASPAGPQGLFCRIRSWRGAAGAENPCFDGRSDCAETRILFAKLERRYGLLRSVLDQYLFAGLRHRPVPCDRCGLPPCAGKRSRGIFCQQGNAGLTIATFPLLPLRTRSSGVSAPITFGTLAEYPASDQAERNVEQARVKLNASLAAFALQPHAGFDLINGYTSDFSRRGVCATTDAPKPSACGTSVLHHCGSLQFYLAHRTRSPCICRERDHCRAPVRAIPRLSCHFRRTSFEPYRSRAQSLFEP